MRSILALAGASLALQFTQKVPFPDRHGVTSEAAPSTLGSTVSTPDGTDYDYEVTPDSSPSLGATNDEEITDLGDSFWSNIFGSDDDDSDNDSDDDSDDDDDDDDDDDRYDLRSDLFRHRHGHRSSHGHRTHWRPSPFVTLFDQPLSDDYDNDVPNLLLGLLSMIPRLMPVPLPRLPMAPPSAMFTITLGGPQRDMPPPRTNTFPDMTFMLPRQQMTFVPPRQQMDFVPPEARTQVDFVLPGSDEQDTPIDENPTQPPATEPPATEPPATQPPATQPPATQPPATQPPATQPPATQPPQRATQPPATTPAPLTPPAAVSPKRPPIEIAPPASVEFAPPPPKTTGRPDVVSYRSAP